MTKTEQLLDAQVSYLKDIRDLLVIVKDQLIKNGDKLEKLTRAS